MRHWWITVWGLPSYIILVKTALEGTVMVPGNVPTQAWSSYNSDLLQVAPSLFCQYNFLIWRMCLGSHCVPPVPPVVYLPPALTQTVPWPGRGSTGPSAPDNLLHIQNNVLTDLADHIDLSCSCHCKSHRSSKAWAKQFLSPAVENG